MKSKRNNYLPPDNMVSNFFGEKKMNERITSDPQVCGGEPCVKGTRISVRIILSHIASGEDYSTILKQFPRIQQLLATDKYDTKKIPGVYLDLRLKFSNTIYA